MEDGERLTRFSADDFNVLSRAIPKEMLLQQMEFIVKEINEFNEDVYKRQLYKYTAKKSGSKAKAVKKPKRVTNVKVKKGKRKMTVRWKRDRKAAGYQITYARNKKFTKGKKNVTITRRCV